MDQEQIFKYAVERADGHIFKYESTKSARVVLRFLRLKYMNPMPAVASFTPHIDRRPVAIYKLEAEYERTMD